MSIEGVPAELRTTDRWAFSDLRALYINCTLKRSPEPSHTQGLLELSKAIMVANGVAVNEVRAVDHELAPGVWPRHARARGRAPRLAFGLRARPGRGHSRPRYADLAR
jgi:hypothetical protein